MSTILLHEIDALKTMILALGADVEERVHRAVHAVCRRDATLAQQIVDGDREIDQMENAVEEQGIKILALYQPVANDLRFVVVTLEINNDLERIGDLAVNMAERAVALAHNPREMPDLGLREMAAKAQSMLKASMDALVRLDVRLAREVCQSDNEIDAMNKHAYDAVKRDIVRDPENVDGLISLLSVCRNLERVADHATNIAQDVIYLLEGRTVRHQQPDEVGET